jgi:hypothetical protein
MLLKKYNVGVTQLISHRNLMLLGSSKNYNEMNLDMKQQSCFSTKEREREEKTKEFAKYIYSIKYHITMASVEPAGMIPNLSRSSGKVGN